MAFNRKLPGPNSRCLFGPPSDPLPYFRSRPLLAIKDFARRNTGNEPLETPNRIQKIALPRRVRPHEQSQRSDLDLLVHEALEVFETNPFQHGSDPGLVRPARRDRSTRG